MDFTQAILYSTVTNLPFFYLIFDYKAKDRGHRLIPVNTMAMHPNSNADDPGLIQAKQRDVDLRGSVRKTIEEVIKMDYDGYPAKGGYDECQNCPINPIFPGGTCDHANALKQS